MKGLQDRAGFDSDRPPAGSHVLWRSLLHGSRTRVRLLLVVYGIVFAVLFGIQLTQQLPAAGQGLNTERQGELLASLDAFDRGGPPLTRLSAGSHESYDPIAIDDDRGVFVYVPVVGHLLGTTDLDVLMKWFYLAFFIPLLALYPILFYELTDSLIVGFASSPLLLSYSSFFKNSGIFWIPAWSNLLLLPCLLLIAKRWNGRSFWYLVGLALVASLVSSMRANAGLPFLLGAMILAAWRLPSLYRRLGGIALLLFAYLSVTSFAMHAVQTQRDDLIHTDFTSAYPNGHPLWHNAYMGLGYLKNKYGIHITDQSSRDAAYREDPTANVPSRKYEATLRRLYFRILVDDPGFVLKTYVLKAVVVASRAVRRFPALVVLAPLALLMRSRRRTKFAQILLIVPAGVLGGLAPVLTNPVPIPEIEAGWFSFLVLAWLLTLGWLLREVELQTWRMWFAIRQAFAVNDRLVGFPLRIKLRALARERWRSIDFRRSTVGVRAGRPSRARSLGASVIAIAVIAAVFAASSLIRPTEAASAYWWRQGPLIDKRGLPPAVIRWSFKDGTPSKWFNDLARTERWARGVSVQTSPHRFGYQLNSESVLLSPGSYWLALDGRVKSGGLEFGVIDARTLRWIGSNAYWYGQSYSPSRSMVTQFDLARATRVQFVIANYGSPLKVVSTWDLAGLSLHRLESGCVLRNPYAWFGAAQ
jgi:hypothetical protein